LRLIKGLIDSSESAVIRINDSVEFYKLKKEIRGKSFLKIEKVNEGIGHFSSNIISNQMRIDSVIYNHNERFLFSFIKNQPFSIVFEKTW